MNKALFIICLNAVILAAWTMPAFCEMSSASYQIPTAVLSGGGSPAGSAGYSINSTLGQSSPLMKTDTPVGSASFALLPGFWYTVSAFDTSCPGGFFDDSDNDGITDGLEDADQDGILGLADNETHPCNADTDGDGIQDGTELGLTLADIGPNTDTDIFNPDLDPDSTTDPLNPDTDNDGLADGDEDSNFNGRIDSGETNPNFPNNIKAMPWLQLLLND